MRPPPFLFDLDGTLAETLDDIAVSVNHVRASHGLPPAAAAVVRGLVGDGARTLLRRALAPAFAGGVVPEPALDAAFAQYVAHHAGECTRRVRLFPGVRPHLAALADAGHPLAVVTNKPERFARAIVRHLGLGDLLPVVVGGDTLPQRKPEPAPLLHALQQLDAVPGRGTMAGDGVQDLRAGKAAGLCTIACLFGYGEPADLRAEGADVWWRAFGEPE
jgi:phosphoglycolate phosphatase